MQNYYPFGEDMGDATMNYAALPINLHLYNGKEWQPELNLNTYDFGARHYDPVLGRWTSADPLAEEAEDMSPYNYVENNPMNLMDPDGMQANGCIGCGTNFDTNIGGGGIPGWSIFGAGANGVSQFFQAGGAFNITKAKVTTQNWAGLKNVQGNQAQTGDTKDYNPDDDPRYKAWEARTKKALDAYGKTVWERITNKNNWWDMITDQGGYEPNPHIVREAYIGGDVGSLFVGGEGPELLKEIEVVKEIEVAKNGETAATKLGRAMHKAYKADLVDKINTFKEYVIPNTLKRIDFIDFNTKTIYELKPNNSRAISEGMKQLQEYKALIEKEFGPGWKTVLDTY